MNDALYHEQLLELAREPLHFGTLDHPDLVWHGHNASCGDELTIFVKLSPDKLRIAELSWQGQGCVISQAAMSVVAELVQGKALEELARLSFEQVLGELGLNQISPGRVRCVMLGAQTIKEKVMLPATA